MSFNWADYLRFAESLVSTPSSPGPEEAALRAAISRAYYAAFCSARNLAESRGEMTRARRSTDHRLVIDHFQDAPEFVRQQIAYSVVLIDEIDLHLHPAWQKTVVVLKLILWVIKNQ